MLRTWLLGHRKAAAGVASVAVVCASTGVVVALDGDGGPDGYVAVGAAGAAPTKPGDRVAPTGEVRLVPLDPPEADGPGGSSAAEGAPAGKGAGKSGDGAPAAGGAAGLGDVPATEGTPSESAAPSGAAKPPKGATPGKDGAATPSTSPSTGSGGSGGSSPAGPAKLKVGDPVLKKADKRWCQKVTLPLTNSGGSAVRSGTATFETHVIGALGIDWATVEVTKKLPVPIGAGEQVRKTWTVCVDSWRVPLGMRLETKDVDVDWK